MSRTHADEPGSAHRDPHRDPRRESRSEARREPGALVESHAHLVQLGRSLGMADLGACRSAPEMLDRIADHARSLASDAWVLAHGARPQGWDDPRWPSGAELDHASGGRPACAWCFDYHAMLGSTRALALAGIDASTRHENGRVELDAEGNPTGLLLEHAALALWERVPEPAPDERRALVRAACDHLAQLGFGAVHDLKAQPWLGALLGDMDRAGELPVRVTLFALLDDLDRLAESRRAWQTDRVALGGGKIFTDGTLNSRTAHTLHPYADAPPDRSCGMAMMSPVQIAEAVRRVDRMGLSLAAHAIGDGAVRAVLDAIEFARPRTPGFRVEHAELIDPDDVPRFASLGVIASVQPCHLLPDIEALRRAVPDRLDRVLPIRALIASGLVPGRGIVFGSDVPIVRADPVDSIRAAVDRRRPGMPVEQAVSPDQAVDEATAWSCFARC